MSEGNEQVGGFVDGQCRPCHRKHVQTTADIFCVSCNEYQCRECSSVHTFYEFMRDHELIDAGEEHIPSKRINKVDMKGLDTCQKHGKLFEYYCNDDQTLGCSSCAIVDHRRCNKIEEIQSIATDEDLTRVREELYGTVAALNETNDNLDQAEDQLTTRVECIPSCISEIRRDMEKLIDTFEKSVNKYADKYRNKKIIEWTTRKRECEDKISDIDALLSTINNIHQYGTACQKFVMEKQRKENVTQTVQNEKTFCKKLETIGINCEFQGHYRNLKTGMENVLNPATVAIYEIIPTKTWLRREQSIDLVTCDDVAVEPFYSGMVFLHDGRLLVVDNANMQCLIYDIKLQLLERYNCISKHPQSVVVVSIDTIAVTCGSRIDFLSVSETNSANHVKTLETDAKYDSISIKDDNTFVVGAYGYKKPVRMVSHDGVESDFDLRIPVDEYKFGQCCCTYIRSSDKIVLSNNDTNTVYVHDTLANTTIEVTSELIKSPHGVAIGSRNRIFVCSTDNNCLVEMTEAGRILCAHRIALKRPRYVCISDDCSRLAVVEISNEARKLQIYSME